MITPRIEAGIMLHDSISGRVEAWVNRHPLITLLGIVAIALAATILVERLPIK